jgi:phosphate/sulfate permease
LALFGVLSIYLFAIACFRSLSLGANDIGNLQELDF